LTYPEWTQKTLLLGSALSRTAAAALLLCWRLSVAYDWHTLLHSLVAELWLWLLLAAWILLFGLSATHCVKCEESEERERVVVEKVLETWKGFFSC